MVNLRTHNKMIEGIVPYIVAITTAHVFKSAEQIPTDTNVPHVEVN